MALKESTTIVGFHVIHHHMLNRPKKFSKMTRDVAQNSGPCALAFSFVAFLNSKSHSNIFVGLLEDSIHSPLPHCSPTPL